jgi:DNA-binding PadR family transcriptional regulator
MIANLMVPGAGSVKVNKRNSRIYFQPTEEGSQEGKEERRNWNKTEQSKQCYFLGYFSQYSSKKCDKSKPTFKKIPGFSVL